MEHGATESVKEQSQMEVTVKIEVEVAEPSTKMDLSHLKQEPVLVQSVKSEPALLVKVEILEDSCQDGNEQKCVRDASKLSGTGSINEACCAGDLLNVKQELDNVDTEPTVVQHTDMYYTANKMDLSHLKQEPVSVQSVKSEPALLVKVEILEDSCQDGNEQQCVRVASTPSGTGSINKACCAGDLPNVKQELNHVDTEPTVLQHTDMYYTTNKNMSAVKEVNRIVDDGNEAMPCYEEKKESTEDELRGTKIISCKYCSQITTEEDYNETQYRLGQQNCHQQHYLGQHRAMSSNSFMCEACSRVIYKSCLLSSSKTSVTTSTADVPSNRKQPETTHDETIKTKQKPMECDVSEKGYSSKTNYQSNTDEKSHHYEVNFAQNSDLAKHMENHKGMSVHTGEKPYQCDMCNAKYAKASGLTRHIRVHTGEKPYQCAMCDAKFSQGGHLTQHMRVHTGEKPYQCNMCNAKFAHRYALTQHTSVHTRVKPYQCNKCDAKFAKSGGLTVHMRVHTGEKPYQCDVCDAKFAQSGGLSQHMSVHTGEKPYQCDMCDAKFAKSSSLTVHMRVHTGTKPYQCDMCNTKFAHRQSLIQHMRIHSGEKPYQCNMCHAKFALRYVLNRHMRVHTGKKHYSCDKCDAKYTLNSSLSLHMKKVHT